MIFFKKKHFTQINYQNLPEHIAIIMDGNGRWAKKRALPRSLGHREGANTLKRISGFCHDIGLKYLTVFAFSTENWKRPKEEVAFLMQLLLDYFKNAESHLEGKKIKIRVIGDISKFSSEVKFEISRVIEKTSTNTGLTLTLAINYGSRDELTNSIRDLAYDIKNGTLDPEDITESVISQKLYTHWMPDPDLLIRPGGEMRISNYLLWQCAYSEFWFHDVLWPDFDKEHILQAILAYQNRNRRFGGI